MNKTITYLADFFKVMKGGLWMFCNVVRLRHDAEFRVRRESVNSFQNVKGDMRR